MVQETPSNAAVTLLEVEGDTRLKKEYVAPIESAQDDDTA